MSDTEQAPLKAKLTSVPLVEFLEEYPPHAAAILDVPVSHAETGAPVMQAICEWPLVSLRCPKEDTIQIFKPEGKSATLVFGSERYIFIHYVCRNCPDVEKV